MPYSLTWLPGVLKDAGLKVAPVDGWEDRGRGDVGPIRGVICHYTAGPKTGNMPSLNTVKNGRSDLPGPLAQLGLGRDGTYYVIAAGRCNHAGKGVWQGISSGNSSFIGIEAENTGRANDFPWPAVQMDAYYRGVAAILEHIGRDADSCCGHSEYARPVGRKRDPNFDMNAFRSSVVAILNGAAPPPVLIPPVELVRGRPTLRRGAQGPLVDEIQTKLGVAGPDVFGPKTEAAVRAFQRSRGLVADGIVGPRTWAALDEVKEPLTIEPPLPQPPAGGTGKLAWGAKVSPAFKDKVFAISGQIGCDPNDLMACMAFETGEIFDPKVKNKKSRATGLIQFMPTTATGLGTSTAALAAMTPEEQLDYVAKYFRWHPGVRTLEDLYMAILWPRAVGKSDGYLLFAEPSVQYKQNKGLDLDEDGRVTKWEAAAAVRGKLEKGLTDDYRG